MKLLKNVLGFLLLSMLATTVSASDLFEGRILVMNLGDSEVQLHPHKTQSANEAQIFTGLYEGLVVYDPQTLQPLPGAAQKWEFSEGQRVITFTLKPDLKFSDGSPLTARDFYKTFVKLLSPDTKAPFAFLLDDVIGAAEFRLGQTRNPGRLGMQVIDERTLVFRLRSPTPHFLSILCHYSLSPLHPDALTETVPAKNFAVNGPYILAEATDQIIVLKKNPYYWDKIGVSIEEIHILRMGDAEKATELFRRGAIDWLASGIDFTQPLNEQSQVVSAMYASSYLYFRTENKVYQNPDIRKALINLLPLEQLRKNQTLPSTTLIPQVDPYPTIQGYDKPNIELGLQLLKDAGYEKGSGLPPLSIYLPEGEESNSLAKQIQEALKIHLPTLQVLYNPVSWREYYRSQGTTEHDIGFQSWIGDFPDPLTFLAMWETGSSLNAFSFSNPEFDSLLATSRTQTGKERFNTLSLAEKLLLDTGAIIPLGFSISVNIIDQSSIGGWHSNPFDLHPFKNMYFTAPRSLPGTVFFGKPALTF